jgi:hypothetical protein
MTPGLVVTFTLLALWQLGREKVFFLAGALWAMPSWLKVSA